MATVQEMSAKELLDRIMRKTPLLNWPDDYREVSEEIIRRMYPHMREHQDAEPAAQPSATPTKQGIHIDTEYLNEPKTPTHKPGCPRYSGAGECDCDTNESGAYTADRCHVCDELVSECKCAPVSASAREAQVTDIAREIQYEWDNGASVTVEIAAQTILSRHFPAAHGAPAAHITGEQFLARRGFADSRNYSSTELGPLLEEYARGGAPAEPQRWRDVKVELPKYSLDVLFYTTDADGLVDSCIYVGWLDGDGKWYASNLHEEYCVTGVTHWQPLPEPPKERP